MALTDDEIKILVRKAYFDDLFRAARAYSTGR